MISRIAQGFMKLPAAGNIRFTIIGNIQGSNPALTINPAMSC